MAATRMNFEGSGTIGNPSGRGRQQSLMYLPGKVETDTQSSTFTTRKESENSTPKKRSPRRGGVGEKREKPGRHRILYLQQTIHKDYPLHFFLPSFHIYTEISISNLYPEICISRRVSTELISHLHSLYTQKTDSEVHHPQGPDAKPSTPLLG